MHVPKAFTNTRVHKHKGGLHKHKGSQTQGRRTGKDRHVHVTAAQQHAALPARSARASPASHGHTSFVGMCIAVW